MKEVLEKAKDKSTCVFYSGGADSSLLLYQVKDYDFPVVTFSEDWTKEQVKKLEQIIFDYDLTLYTYPPRNRYFVPNEDGISLVDEYGFSGSVIPVIRDIEDSDSGCVAELSKRRFSDFSFGFDCVLTGFLKSDFHFLTGNPMDEVKIQNNLTFIQPLWNWSKEEVREEVERLRLPVINKTGEISACSKCLTTDRPFCHLENKVIEPISWNPAQNLEIFRDKFGYFQEHL